jgi:hypothetical protein
MQSTSWTEEHSKALREFLESGLSFARIADAISEIPTTIPQRRDLPRQRMGCGSGQQPGPGCRREPTRRGCTAHERHAPESADDAESEREDHQALLRRNRSPLR